MVPPEIIKENNKLIAAFMGWTYDYSGVNWAVPTTSNLIPETENYRSGTRVPDEKLVFQSNWHWLMPVVEYIESLKDEHHGRFAVYICSNNCTIQSTRFRPDQPIPNPPHYFFDHHGESKIEATYYAVLSFIKWWNKHNN